LVWPKASTSGTWRHPQTPDAPISQQVAGMKINFTKNEYAALIEMILIADWVMNAHEEEPRNATKPYADLRRKLLSHHKEMGMEDDFVYEPEDDEYYETAEYEERSAHMRFIEEYDENAFWDALATRLAHRDLAGQEASGVVEPLSPEQRFMKLQELEEHYQEEFARSGLDNLRIESKAGMH